MVNPENKGNGEFEFADGNVVNGNGNEKNDEDIKGSLQYFKKENDIKEEADMNNNIASSNDGNSSNNFNIDSVAKHTATDLGALSNSATMTTTTTPTTPKKRKPKVPKRLRDNKDILDISSFSPYSNSTYKSWINKDLRQDLAILHYVLEESRRLIVVTGAGISVAAGIPDFRSQQGLFASLKEELNLKGSGKAMFDSSVYQDDTSLANFHTTLRDLHKLCTSCSPTPFHKYLNEISRQNRLNRLYTQNIDCLDSALTHLTTQVPLKQPYPKTIQLHGTIGTMVCTRCHWIGPLNPDIFADEGAPECAECIELDNIREIAGKRSQGIGKLRPRIVLYNETNPDAEAIGSVTEEDLTCKPDGLIVVGTSLKIPGVRRIVKEMAQAVHHAKGAVIWINVDEFPQLTNQFEGCFDLFVKGDCQIIPQLINDYEQEKEEIEKQKEKEKLERKAKSEERALKRELKQKEKSNQSTLNFKSIKRNKSETNSNKKQKLITKDIPTTTSTTSTTIPALTSTITTFTN